MKKADYNKKDKKETGKMYYSSKTMIHHKVVCHPISTPIFFFYTIMSVINGSASLLLLGVAAALGAWVLEEIFMATSGAKNSGKCFRQRSDAAESGKDLSEKEICARAMPERSFHPGEMLFMSNHGRIVFLKNRAS